MPSPPDPIYREASALWLEVFGERPPMNIDGSRLLEIVVKRLPVELPLRLRAAELAYGLVFPRPSPEQPETEPSVVET